MKISLTEQTMIFLLSILLGAFLSFIFDFFRIFRAVFKKGILIILLQDLLYYIFCAVITFLFILSLNSGQIRGFIIIGEIIGWLIYYLTFGTMIMKFVKKILRIVKFMILFIYRSILFPVFLFFSKICVKIIKKIANKRKKKQKNTWIIAILYCIIQ